MFNLDEHLAKYTALLTEETNLKNIQRVIASLEKQREQSRRVIIIGNGASASIASHVALDLTKQARLRAITFHDPSLITAYSNDYGYEFALKKMLEHFADPTDILIAVSVSGSSNNIVNAARFWKDVGQNLITFTGQSQENDLRQLGDISIWVDSKAYNIVENVHSIFLTGIIDALIGTDTYSVS